MIRFQSTRLLLGLLGVAVGVAAATPGGAGAFALPQCGGVPVTGQGGGLQASAESIWTSQFNSSSNVDACNGTQGSLGTPAVSYVSSTGKLAAKAWEQEEFGAYPFISKGFPPSEKEIEKLEGAAKHKERAGTLLTIPVAQTAIAVVVNLPSGCSATSAPAPGRLVLTNSTLEQLLRGTLTTWSAIKDSGDAVTGGSCNATAPITRVVPKEASDPEAIVKKYLYLNDSANVWKEKKTWRAIAEVTKWPEEAADPIKKETNVPGYVAEHASTLGISWVHLARPQFGAPAHGAGTQRFWVELQDGVNGAAEPTYADPSNNGDQEANANSNCKETVYRNAGSALPNTNESWNEVGALTQEPHYTLCGLSYVFALNKYSAYATAASPPSEAEARTVHDYLRYVLSVEPGGGQLAIGASGTDYGKLPAEVFNIARPGTSTIEY